MVAPPSLQCAIKERLPVSLQHYLPGLRAGVELTGSTLDIAPTVLQMAGVTPPAHLDGKPLSLTDS